MSGCSSPLAGHGWTIREMVSIALFFSYPLKIHGDWWLAEVSYSELSVTLRDLFCLLQGAVKTPRLGGKFHSAFRNIIPVTTPIELRRLLMLPRRKERGKISPKILLICWVGVVKNPLCSDGWGRGELKENWIMLEVNRKVLLKWRIGMSQETPELFTGEQGGRSESSNIFLFFFYVYDDMVLLYYLFIFFLGDDRTPLKFCKFGCYLL